MSEYKGFNIKGDWPGETGDVYIGDPIHPPGYYPPYDDPWIHPLDRDRRIWPREFPNWPPKTPDDVTDYINKIKEEKPKKTPEFRHRSTTDKSKVRAIDVALPGHTKESITLSLENNKLRIGLYTSDFMKDINVQDWPEYEETLVFDLNEHEEEIESAVIKNGILTILIKNIKIEAKPKFIGVTGA